MTVTYEKWLRGVVRAVIPKPLDTMVRDEHKKIDPLYPYETSADFIREGDSNIFKCRS